MQSKHHTLPFPLPPEYKLANISDILVLSRVYAEAFADDPVRQWLVGAANTRSWRGRWLSAGVLRSGLSEGFVLTNQARDSLLILMPPSPGKPSTIGMTQAALGLGVRLGRALWLKQQMQRLAPVEPHWHVLVLATAPAVQGKGKGAALLQPLLQHVHQSGEMLWLESSNPTNDPFYQRLGLQPVGTLQLPNGHEMTLRATRCADES